MEGERRIMEKETLGGRPQRIGRLYCETNYGTGQDTLKITVGYCPQCKHKVGLDKKELEELAKELPPRFWFFIQRLLHTRIIVPH